METFATTRARTCNCDSCECADSFSGPKCEVALENVKDVCERVWKCRLCDGKTMGPGGLCSHCETVEKVRIIHIKDDFDLLERKGSHCMFHDEHSGLHNYSVVP
ncbi:hypothetical protein DPMN_165449 [Dreissena polymorpha]|uniref:Uncharacterized protein n=1 Tax=Dreissena polymorpha TaxID=45954 RepID=A0A9D4IWL5_DREPO|nr:hypothetical protein DPMN_165449 [Dreissena polymorpha]